MSTTTAKSLSPQALQRKNIITALVLVALSFGIAASVFIWRFSHNQTAIPLGSSYSATYEIQPQQPTPQATEH